MQPQQPYNGPGGPPPQPGMPPSGQYPPHPQQPGELPGSVPRTPQQGPNIGPNLYTTQLPQGSRYATPLDTENGTPVAPAGAQYDFITANQRPMKKGLFGAPAGGKGGMSFMKQLIAGGILIVVVGMIIAAGASFYLSSRSDSAKTMLSIAAAQTEIVRVADIGMKRSRGTQAQVLASTTRYSLQSDLNNSISSLKKHRLKATSATLATSKNTKVDASLALASQNNRFDEEFLTIMNGLLLNYQAKVKSAYDSSTNTYDKQVLTESYAHINTIVNSAGVTAPAGQ